MHRSILHGAVLIRHLMLGVPCQRRTR